MSYGKVLLRLTTCILAAAWAQPAPQVVTAPRVDFASVEIKTTRLADDRAALARLANCGFLRIISIGPIPG